MLVVATVVGLVVLASTPADALGAVAKTRLECATAGGGNACETYVVFRADAGEANRLTMSDHKINGTFVYRDRANVVDATGRCEQRGPHAARCPAAHPLVFLRDGDDRLRSLTDVDGYGGEGDDTLIATAGERSLGRGYQLSGNGGDDVITGSDLPDRLEGGAGSDRLQGGAGPDRLYGQAGADDVLGGGGADQLVSDAFLVSTKDAASEDRLTCGDGTDVIQSAPSDTLDVDCEGSALGPSPVPSRRRVRVALTPAATAALANGVVVEAAWYSPGDRLVVGYRIFMRLRRRATRPGGRRASGRPAGARPLRVRRGGPWRW